MQETVVLFLAGFGGASLAGLVVDLARRALTRGRRPLARTLEMYRQMLAEANARQPR